MISQPYNAKPTLDMYSRFMSSLAYRQRFGEMQLCMEGRALHRTAVREYTRSRGVFHSTRRTSPTWLRDQRARDLVYARLRLAVNRQHIRKWVRLLIRHGSRSLYDTEWATYELPKVIKNWMFFLTCVVKYPIRSGDVRLYTQSRRLHRKKEVRFARVMLYMVNWLPVRQFKVRTNRNFKLDEGRAGIREQGA
jgi:hypothetical protein